MEFRFKAILKEKALRQQDLADMMGVSLSAVKQMMAAPSLTTVTLEKIASALNVPIWQLFADPNEVSSQSVATCAPAITCPHCGGKIYLEAKGEPSAECLDIPTE